MSEQVGNIALDSAHTAPAAQGATSAPTRRHKARWLWGGGAVVIVALALLAWVRSAERHGGPAQPEPAAHEAPYLDGKWIRYSSGFAERAGLVFATAQQRSLSPLVHVTGTVDFDPARVAAIGARIAGRVRNVRVVEGESVKAGDVLAEIESAELGEAQATLISARAHYEAAATNQRRELELSAAKISSHREAELATATAAAAKADLDAAEQRIRAMGGSAHSEPGVLLLTSPIAGKVVERQLTRGQFVEPTLTAFRVADLRRVWLQLALFERDLGAVRQGDRVDLMAPGQLQPLVQGSVAYVGEIIDLATKTAQVRVVVEQPEQPLRPGQSVSAAIHTSAPRAQKLVLPRDAVTSVDGKATVFVAGPALAVEPRTVQLGSQDATHVEIDAGLRGDERVAVGGVFALKSEIFR